MPLRVIGYDGASYRSQVLDIRQKAKKETEELKEEIDNRISGDTERKDRYPVVTIILYFGEKL